MSEYKIINLNDSQIELIEKGLDEFDELYITCKLEGKIQIGLQINNSLIAGIIACVTAFKVLYVSTVYVDESYRRKGYGKILMEEMEKKAKLLGVNTIRLDTFSWQGKEFYEALGYKIVGSYKNETDNFSEYFFLKQI